MSAPGHKQTSGVRIGYRARSLACVIGDIRGMLLMTIPQYWHVVALVRLWRR